MELPFAVEASDKRSQLQQSVTDSSSLVTASSQGSLIEPDMYDPILPAKQNPPEHVNILPESPVSNAVASTNNNSVGSRVTSALSYFGVNPSPHKIIPNEENETTETVDFTYVNVWETDEDEVDIIIAGGDPSNAQEEVPSRDILSVLLSGNAQQNEESERIVAFSEKANQAAARASQAKKEGNLQEALDAHTAAAKLFQKAALMLKERNASMATSLLLLSQTHAKSALAIKRVVKLRPKCFAFTEEKASAASSQKDRLRATVRGALDNRTEEDISDSAFLGRATAGPTTSSQNAKAESSKASSSGDGKPESNPVDEMMELERELRDMDMALELGNSIASLDARTQNRMKNSIVEGSFMVVPPGSSSYMSSSTMWGGQHTAPPRNNPNHPGSGTAGVRARANRVQNILEASSTRPVHHHHQAPPQSPAPPRSNGLESSWWGNASTASQVLASSVTSLASVPSCPGDHMPSSNQSASTKQIMQLMDSLKTLGDENAALLREVDGAEQARMEAKAAKEQMRRFKEEYAQRFAALKAALEKFRKGYPEQNGTEKNPVTGSEYVRSAMNADQLQRQEQLIRKLTADLKKEKEESKKKDGALRKYESFYREVKARSAQKAAQRQKETQQRQQAQGRTGLPRSRGSR